MAGKKSKANRRTPTNVAEASGAFRIRIALGERVRFLLDLFESRSEAAAVAGVTPEHLASYIRGSAKPPFELLARLAAAKKLSLDWLATGEGAPMPDEDEEDSHVAVPLQPDGDTRLDAAEEPAPILFLRRWLEDVAPGAVDGLRIVHQRGSANAPVIRDGDMLLVDTSIERIGEDALYVFVRDGRHLARYTETFANGKLALKSRNPDYGTQTLSEAEVAELQLLGRVLWHSGKV